MSLDCNRLNLDIRQRVAAVGRRVTTLCQGEDGWQHQLALCHVQTPPRDPLRQCIIKEVGFFALERPVMP